MRKLLVAALLCMAVSAKSQTLTTINENLWTTGNWQYFDTSVNGASVFAGTVSVQGLGATYGITSSTIVTTGSVVVGSTLTVQGNAFSVGGSTLVVSGGVTTTGGNLNATATGSNYSITTSSGISIGAGLALFQNAGYGVGYAPSAGGVANMPGYGLYLPGNATYGSVNLVYDSFGNTPFIATRDSRNPATTPKWLVNGTGVGISTGTPATVLDVNGSVTLDLGTTGAVLCLTSAHVIGHCTSGASCLTTCTCTCTAN